MRPCCYRHPRRSGIWHRCGTLLLFSGPEAMCEQSRRSVPDEGIPCRSERWLRGLDYAEAESARADSERRQHADTGLQSRNRFCAQHRCRMGVALRTRAQKGFRSRQHSVADRNPWRKVLPPDRCRDRAEFHAALIGDMRPRRRREGTVFGDNGDVDSVGA